jgi:outer membrane lipopolysaccharide assembly protein LptE/RlpB
MLAMLRNLSLLTLFLTLIGCGGWHLRGSQDDAINTDLSLNISGGSPEMRAALYRYANLNDIETRESNADVHLTLHSDVYRRRIHSVGVNEQPTEFMLIYDVVVSGQSGNHRLFSQANMRREDIFAYNSENPLAGDNEAQILIEEMRNDLARQLILRAIRQANRQP